MSAAEDIRQTLQDLSLTPNKALGQNFLVDPRAIARILHAAEIDGAPVLEIGPGLGALTEGLLARARTVVAVEIDARMAAALQARFASALRLLHGDFLKVDFPAIQAELGEDYRVVGNLPYYATTPICLRLLQGPALPRRMTLMVQREAAARFSARSGERVYGPLSVLAQAYYTPTPVLTLAPDSFYPAPEVESVVMTLARNDRPVAPQLPGLLKAAFAMRRKTLCNNLKARYPARDLPALLERAGLGASIRAEALTPAQFVALSQIL